MEKSNIAWHPAFVGAIQLELDAYTDSLEFHTEYQLTAEPLKIDCIVIKKAKDVVIKKNFAAIFRDVNILEYKSPDDYVSVEDFYKVYGYACLYASFGKIPVTNLTVSFVQSRHPGKLLRHLKNVRGYVVEEKHPGIYTVRGDILPIQLIDNRRLSAEENLWFKGLSNRLDPFMVARIGEKADRYNKDFRINVYLDTIIRANLHAVEEATRMSRTTESLEEMLVRIGWADRLEAKIEARVEERKALDIARNMVNLGYPVEAVVSATMLEPEKVQELLERQKEKCCCL